MYNFLLDTVASFSARREDHFFLNWTFPSDFVELGSEILYLFLAEKIVGFFFCNFVRFWLTFLN